MRFPFVAESAAPCTHPPHPGLGVRGDSKHPRPVDIRAGAGAVTVVLAFLAWFGLALPAAAMTIDGDLSDWLAAAPAGTVADWTPRPGIAWSEEDQIHSYLGPGYGGQHYDMEAFYATYVGSDLYLAIVTGKAPASGSWEPGDIGLDLDGDGLYDYAIVTFAGGLGLGVAGDVYRADDWALGLWTQPGEHIADWHHPPQSLAGAGTAYQAAHPTVVTAGSPVGHTSLTYTEATYGGAVPTQLGAYSSGYGRHYVIETRVPLDLLGLAVRPEAIDLHWTMACANDWGHLRIRGGAVTHTESVPLPGTWLLVGLGLLGLRRRQPVVSQVR